MSSKMKQWVALTVVGCLAVLAAGWFLLVSPKRSDAAAVRADVATQTTTNSGLRTQLAMLKAQAKTLPVQQAKLARVAAKIPDNPALPALIRALTAAADDADVELVSLTKGDEAPVVAATSPGATGTTPGAKTPTATTPGAKTPTGTTPGSKTAPGATSTSATLASTTAATSQFSPGVLTSIPVTISVVGGYFQIEQFFDKLENLARAAKVTGFSMSPGANPMKPPAQGTAGPAVESGKVLVANVTANVYMAAGRGLVPAAAAPAK